MPSGNFLATRHEIFTCKLIWIIEVASHWPGKGRPRRSNIIFLCVSYKIAAEGRYEGTEESSRGARRRLGAEHMTIKKLRFFISATRKQIKDGRQDPSREFCKPAIGSRLATHLLGTCGYCLFPLVSRGTPRPHNSFVDKAIASIGSSGGAQTSANKQKSVVRSEPYCTRVRPTDIWDRAQ